MRHIITYLLILGCFLIGCTRNSFEVEDYRQNNQVPDSTDGNKSIVSYYPRIYGYAGDTKDNVTEFPAGCITEAFAFVKGLQLIQWRYYKSFSAGTLSPVEQPMELVNGLYDFYMVSTKSSVYPPVFKQGIASDIYNNIDYLWYKVTSQVIENPTTLSINFDHSCAQIVLNVKNQEGDSIAQWISYASMHVPDVSNCQWDLYTGVISPATTIDSDSLKAFNCQGLSGNMVIVPIKDITELSVYLSVQLYQENEPRGYPLTLPVPDGQMTGGNSYHYLIEFTKDTVYIGDVNIAPWIEVDEDGNPLYPTIET